MRLSLLHRWQCASVRLGVRLVNEEEIGLFCLVTIYRWLRTIISQSRHHGMPWSTTLRPQAPIFQAFQSLYLSDLSWAGKPKSPILAIPALAYGTLLSPQRDYRSIMWGTFTASQVTPRAGFPVCISAQEWHLSLQCPLWDVLCASTC